MAVFRPHVTTRFRPATSQDMEGLWWRPGLLSLRGVEPDKQIQRESARDGVELSAGVRGLSIYRAGQNAHATVAAARPKKKPAAAGFFQLQQRITGETGSTAPGS